MFKKEIYSARRSELKQLMKSGIILIPGNTEAPFTSKGNSYPFRQDSNFLYFTGVDIPGLTLVIDVDADEEYLYGNDLSIEEQVWVGQFPSVNDFALKSDIANAAEFSNLFNFFSKTKIKDCPVHFLPPSTPQIELELQKLLSLGSKELNSRVSVPLIQSVVQLRSKKDEFEIKEIESAINIAQKMHSTAMIMAMPGAHEQDIKGVIEGIAISNGGRLSFKSIVTTRGDILHNLSSYHTLEKNRLLLIDAGAETASHYSSDITRTTPVGRSFTRLQKNIYEIVLKSNLEAIEAIKPGTPFREIHLQAALTITRGLKELGLMKGSPEEAVQAGAHALFFPHGLGHMLGLDVHDMENMGEDFVGYNESFIRSDQFGLAYLRLAKPLESGFVVTIEPGIYFIPSLIDQWQNEKRFDAFINYNHLQPYLGLGGIRIEDDVLVTDSGSRLLGNPIPKTVQELETL
jgi:Xaa-Pro aminopeptidase